MLTAILEYCYNFSGQGIYLLHQQKLQNYITPAVCYIQNIQQPALMCITLTNSRGFPETPENAPYREYAHLKTETNKTLNQR